MSLAALKPWPVGSQVRLTRDLFESIAGVEGAPAAAAGVILERIKFDFDEQWNYSIAHDETPWPINWRQEHLVLTLRADDGWDDWPLGPP